MKRVSVIDYGVSNLLSVRRALEHCDAEVELVQTAGAIRAADRVVLPGVGAFEDGMRGLRDRSFVDPIREFADTGRPFLGICLGMQMMFDASEEFGEHEGIGLIPGRIVPIPRHGLTGAAHKIPHIGWNTLGSAASGRDWGGTVLDGIDDGSYAYFVHSFTAAPAQDDDRLADTDYNGLVLSAVVASGNLYGAQFHPEKSGATGLQVVRNFLAL
ncbi:MAG: imidazole glycerol phosphate synthase subunit HisH [Myxococcales bacterium]|nr:imidazole glycerol phosphate synthase subunit HisH [Myxococcales bacterium]